MRQASLDLPPRERRRPKAETPETPRSPALHICAWCGSDLAPFGKGSPFDIATMVWACSKHRSLLG